MDLKISLTSVDAATEVGHWEQKLQEIHHVWTGRDYSNDSIAENSQNPETSPGDLSRLAVTQTPVENHQLTLM